MKVDSSELGHVISEAVGTPLSVEVREREVVLMGMLSTQRERDAALQLAHDLAPEMAIVDAIDVMAVMPSELDGLSLSEADVEGFSGAEPGSRDDEALEPGDFTDQALATNPLTASGPSGTASEDDDIAEGEEAFIPPIDPVRDRNNEILGGFQTSALDDNDQGPRAEIAGGIADEALADAIREELLQDAATTGLEIAVEVERGIARLSGTVDDMDDVENVAAVAERVPGVIEVQDELDVRNI